MAGRFCILQAKVDGLQTTVEQLARDLPKIVGDAMRAPRQSVAAGNKQLGTT
jgi:hypothetical protein